MLNGWTADANYRQPMQMHEVRREQQLPDDLNKYLTVRRRRLTNAILMFDAGHCVFGASEDSGCVAKLKNPRTTCVISASTVHQLIHHLTTENHSVSFN